MDRFVSVDPTVGIPGSHAGKVIGNSFGLAFPQAASAGYGFLAPNFFKVNSRLLRKPVIPPDLLLDTAPLFFS
jgi:hypothetical protein